MCSEQLNPLNGAQDAAYEIHMLYSEVSLGDQDEPGVH